MQQKAMAIDPVPAISNSTQKLENLWRRKLRKLRVPHHVFHGQYALGSDPRVLSVFLVILCFWDNRSETRQRR